MFHVKQRNKCSNVTDCVCIKAAKKLTLSSGSNHANILEKEKPVVKIRYGLTASLSIDNQSSMMSGQFLRLEFLPVFVALREPSGQESAGD